MRGAAGAGRREGATRALAFFPWKLHSPLSKRRFKCFSKHASSDRHHNPGRRGARPGRITWGGRPITRPHGSGNGLPGWLGRSGTGLPGPAPAVPCVAEHLASWHQHETRKGAGEAVLCLPWLGLVFEQGRVGNTHTPQYLCCTSPAAPTPDACSQQHTW